MKFQNRRGRRESSQPRELFTSHSLVHKLHLHLQGLLSKDFSRSMGYNILTFSLASWVFRDKEVTVSLGVHHPTHWPRAHYSLGTTWEARRQWAVGMLYPSHCQQAPRSLATSETGFHTARGDSTCQQLSQWQGHWHIWQNRVLSGSPDCLFCRNMAHKTGQTLTPQPSRVILPRQDTWRSETTSSFSKLVPHQAWRDGTFPPPKLFSLESPDSQAKEYTSEWETGLWFMEKES